MSDAAAIGAIPLPSELFPATVGASPLLPELFPAAVTAVVESPFARMLATFELSPETSSIEAEADALAALAPQIEFRSSRPSPNGAAPPGSPSLSAPGPRPAVTLAVAAGATSPAVAEPTAPAPEIGKPGLPSPDPVQTTFATLPIREAGASVPPPALNLPPDLLRAGARPRTKPSANLAVEPNLAAEHSLEATDEPREPTPSPTRRIDIRLPGSQAGPGPRVAVTAPGPSVSPSGGAPTYGAAAAAESSLVVSESSPAPATSRPSDAAALLAGPELGSQLGERVGWMLRGDVHSAQIRVFPRDLGSVRINLNVQPDGVEIEMEASSALMVEELHQAAPRLRALLSEQGLGLTHLEIGQQKFEGQRHGANGSRSRPGTDTAGGAEAAEEDSRAGDAGSIRITMPRLIDVFA